MFLLAKCQYNANNNATDNANGAPNRRGKPSVKTPVLHNNTS